jgi:hypothetical protein
VVTGFSDQGCGNRAYVIYVNHQVLAAFGDLTELAIAPVPPSAHHVKGGTVTVDDLARFEVVSLTAAEGTEAPYPTGEA